MSLLELPQELFEHVLSQVVYRFDIAQDRTCVEGTRLRPLRLVSRRFRDMTENTFIDVAISVRKVDITTDSLRTLQAIGEHSSGYGRCVRKIIVERQHPTAKRYEADKADRLNLQKTGKGRDRLAQAFRRTPNIRDVEIPPPWISHMRWLYMRDSSIIDLSQIMPDSDLCNVVLEALKGTDIKIRSFVVRSEKNTSIFAKRHGYSPRRGGGFDSAVFEGMEKLTLPLEFEHKILDVTGMKEFDELAQNWLDFTNRILDSPLRELDLCCAVKGFRTDDVVSLLSHGWLNTLTHLTLSSLRLHASTLQSFVSPARNGRLRSIVLDSIELSQGCWHEVIESLRDSLPDDHALRRLELVELTQEKRKVEFHNFSFLPQSSWSLQGDGSKRELDELLSYMHVIGF